MARALHASVVMTERPLRILLMDQNEMRASVVGDSLEEQGYADVIVVRETQNLLKEIVEADPDVIVMDLENPSRDVLEQMFQVSRSVPRPVAMNESRRLSEVAQCVVTAASSATSIPRTG